MDVPRITDRVDQSAARWVPGVLRWTAALMWLANLNWKVPPDFGRDGSTCRALCRYVEAGAAHPVAPGSGWVFEHVISPNLAVFGWVTLFVEAALVALLASGRHVRTAAALGIAQSLAIGLSVANAPGEWYWTYVLMVVLHLAVLFSAPDAPAQQASTTALVTFGYGVLVGLAHLGAGFTGSDDWHLFSQDTAVPGQWGRATFPGSIALGLAFVVVGLSAWWAVERLSPDRRRMIGWAMVVAAAVMLLTYRQGGLTVGLGSRPGNAAMLAATGLALAVPAPSGGRGDLRSRRSAPPG